MASRLPALLTADEAAAVLGLHPKTVYAWARRGMLPVYRLPGGVLRFDEDELAAWISGRSRRPTR
jgi:excisionase family DNA binding protein